MPASAQPRVLVVDDEEPVRTFVRDALRHHGYDVTTASDGPEAIQAVAREPRFDLFVVDMVMPRMRGDQLVREIRQSEPDAKVLYFTAFSDTLFDEIGTLWEHEAFLDKPVTLQALAEAVSLLLYGHTRGPQ